MDRTASGILGIQLTLVGVLLVVFFEGVYPYPFLGFVLGVLGTAVVLESVFVRSTDV